MPHDPGQFEPPWRAKLTPAEEKAFADKTGERAQALAKRISAARRTLTDRVVAEASFFALVLLLLGIGGLVAWAFPPPQKGDRDMAVVGLSTLGGFSACVGVLLVFRPAGSKGDRGALPFLARRYRVWLFGGLMVVPVLAAPVAAVLDTWPGWGPARGHLISASWISWFIGTVGGVVSLWLAVHEIGIPGHVLVHKEILWAAEAWALRRIASDPPKETQEGAGSVRDRAIEGFFTLWCEDFRAACEGSDPTWIRRHLPLAEKLLKLSVAVVRKDDELWFPPDYPNPRLGMLGVDLRYCLTRADATSQPADQEQLAVSLRWIVSAAQAAAVELLNPRALARTLASVVGAYEQAEPGRRRVTMEVIDAVLGYPRQYHSETHAPFHRLHVAFSCQVARAAIAVGDVDVGRHAIESLTVLASRPQERVCTIDPRLRVLAAGALSDVLGYLVLSALDSDCPRTIWQRWMGCLPLEDVVDLDAVAAYVESQAWATTRPQADWQLDTALWGNPAYGQRIRLNLGGGGSATTIEWRAWGLLILLRRATVGGRDPEWRRRLTLESTRILTERMGSLRAQCRRRFLELDVCEDDWWPLAGGSR